ncbi:MAG TPA: hypothetical protein VHT74_11590 [Acetobacteraceae bacterium]|jgi:hypothetical protein|nr:hypothetical protein [Acetobacteraceae bacterium]
MKGRDHRGTDDAGRTLGGAALLGCVVGALLASSVAVVAAASTIEIGPKVGDILVFRQGARAPSDWDFTVATTARPQQTCTLRPDVMTAGGGSLVVEQRLEKPRVYHVHWAGTHTSEGADDCGSKADLTISGSDLQLLTNAVGGAGVEHRSFGGF